MASILKVDTLQKPDGSTPTAADLGIDVAGSIVQVHTYYFPDNRASVTFSSNTQTGTGISTSFTPKFSNSLLLIVMSMNVDCGSGGRYQFGLWRNGTNCLTSSLSHRGFWSMGNNGQSSNDHQQVNGWTIYQNTSTDTATFEISASSYSNSFSINTDGWGTNGIAIYEIAQ